MERAGAGRSRAAHRGASTSPGPTYRPAFGRARRRSGMIAPVDSDNEALAPVCRLLEEAGCVAPWDEARELLEVAADSEELGALVARRCDGEPLAWVTGRTRFCGIEVKVERGVYVPRWQSEPLARAAAALLPDRGVAVDLCTGSGAVAMVLQAAHPAAQVAAIDIDPLAVGCARANGVTTYLGDLAEALPSELAGRIDVLTAIVPYVPRHALGLLPRDVTRFEPRRALDGGETGLDTVRAVVTGSPAWLKPGGWLLMEVGVDQVAEARSLLVASGFGQVSELCDQEGDPRAVMGSLCGPGSEDEPSRHCAEGPPEVRSHRDVQKVVSVEVVSVDERSLRRP